MRGPIWVWVLGFMALIGCGGADMKSKMKSPAGNVISEFEGTVSNASQTPQPKTRTWKRSRIVPNASRLRVGDKDELPLKALQASVQIHGFRARVILDCFFYNDRATTLEGNFQLRLPNGASLYFFAFGQSRFELEQGRVPDKAFLTSAKAGDKSLTEPKQIVTRRVDRWDGPKVAQVVAKEKAAYAYRETVRRRVDPALVEWAGADVFSARVFPLNPQTMHHIVIGYDVDLISVGNVFQFQLDLPEVPDSLVELDVAQVGGSKPVVQPAAEPSVSGVRHVYRYVNPKSRVITAQVSQAGNVALVSHPRSYFVSRFRPAIPAIERDQDKTSAIFLIDTSLSSRPDRFNIWLKLMRSILERNRDSIREFAVLFFNIETFWWQPAYVANTPNNTAELIQYANTLSLEGATNLDQALREAVQPHWRPKSDQKHAGPLFLLSDGAVTWGESDLYALSQRLTEGESSPLFAYTTGLSGTDTRMLNHLTRGSGGALFNVLNDEQVEKAAVAHRQQAWKIKRVSSAECSDLLLAGRPSYLFPDQEVMVVGHELVFVGQERRPLTIDFVLSNGATEKKVSVKIEHQLESQLAHRAYGQVAVAQLESIPSVNEKLAIAYARHFRVPGQTCSLLMLESKADYERYDIRPKEDAFVVKNQPASKLVEKALKQLKSQLNDSKQRLLTFLGKLKTIPGVRWSMPTALELALEPLPQSAFQIKTAAFACRLRHRKSVPPAVNQALSQRVVPYTEVHAEASRRLKYIGKADALKVLSSLVENRPGDSVLSRDVGFSALSWGLGGQAYSLFLKVAKARPFEPLNYLAMARCLTDLNHVDLAILWHEVVLGGNWHNRFGNVRDIAIVEYVGLLRKIERGTMKSAMHDYAMTRLRTLSADLRFQTADVLVVIMWNTDGTDVDLHVTDSAGQTCFYKRPKTRMGGRLTRDVTDGFGPEMFWLKSARRGEFTVRVNYFSSDRVRTATRTKVYATVYRNWGKPAETVSRRVVTLADDKEKHDIMSFQVK